jgi:uncharacterized protein (UPF0548 family)
MKLTPKMRSRLSALEGRPVNFDPGELDLADPSPGWHVDHRFQPLVAEAPGPPEAEGSWEIARRLIRGYEFADPSIVRAFYDERTPLEGRNMVLELRALNLVRVYVGVRVGSVYDELRTADAREVRVAGWNYRTLEGHVERGQMDWEVWKWLDSGEVCFHVHSVSQTATIRNPAIRMGFWLLRDHERALFLESTDRRMRLLTEAGLQRQGRLRRMRDTSDKLTARRLPAEDRTHGALAARVERGDDR